MKKCTIGTAWKVAAAAIAAGVCFSSAAARAGDSQPGAATVADAGTTRPVVLKAIKVGGLRSGEAMVVSGRGAERVNPNADGGAQCASAGSAAGG